MVEFGLKLEDNKVDKWSTKYIDYEKLKAILKRAKSGFEYRDELIARMPASVIAEVNQERKLRALESSNSLMSGRVSLLSGRSANQQKGGGGGGGDLSPLEMTTAAVPQTVVAIADAHKDEASAAEDTPLLSDPPDTSSQPQPQQQRERSDSFLSFKRNDSFSSLSHLAKMNKTVFKVTSYLGLANEKAMLLQAYEDADDKLLLFQRTYNDEVAKVTDFYADQLREVSERMEALRVDTSFLDESAKKRKMMKKKKKGMMSQQMGRRGSNIVTNMKNTFESILKGSPHHQYGGGDVDGAYSMEDEDDMDLEVLQTFTSGDGDEYETPTRNNNNNNNDGGGENSAQRAKKGDEESLRRKLDLDSIKRAMDDIYRTAKLLHNFSIMNYTGFVKIAKKFDKTFKDHKGLFKGNNCDDGKKAEVLAGKMERLYANWFCDGDIREAQAQMLSKRGDGLMMDWTQLRLGYRLGMCSILALWVAWDCVWGQLSRGEVSIGGRTAFPVFRGCFGLLAWHWFWGLSVYVWTRYRINYIYLFEFDPRNVDTPIDIFNDAVDETLVFLICMLLYYKTESDDQLFPDLIPPGAYPMCLILYTIKCMIFPWKLRKPLWNSIRQVLLASFVSPTFFLTYVGDVFTSMVKVFQDILWSVCFVASGDWLISDKQHATMHHVHAWSDKLWYKNIAIPLICLFPLWLRFNQCLRRYMDTGKRFPNLANAFKYAMSQAVTLFGAFHPLYLMHERNEHYDVSLSDDDEEGIVLSSRHGVNLFQIFWMGLFISSSLYSYIWDVYMDWGLGRREYGFLGPRLMFPRKSHYFSVMAADLILRFMWVLTLIPPQSGAKFELPAYLSAISMVLELFRRTIWSFFRLEHEHRQNTDGYRRVGVVPLHFNTGHKHKYHERHFLGWKVLLEVAVVTSIVIAISAMSVIMAQRAAHQVDELAHPKSHATDL
mmetsp:Transcript_17546/g.35022  ORF Transcript_17546/g.35022 Transcript_17546/m.35022 type:complete len:941 (-) Transcript_17546:116-2938(-)